MVNWHLHAEAKLTALAYAIWVDADLSLCFLYDLAHNSKAQAYTFAIHVCSTSKNAKAAEKFRQIFLCYSDSSVSNFHFKLLFLVAIGGQNLDVPFLRELKGILNQVN